MAGPFSLTGDLSENTPQDANIAAPTENQPLINVAQADVNEQQPLAVGMPQTTIPVTPSIAANRAQKLSIPKPDKFPYDDTFRKMLDGREEDLRKEAAAMKDSEFSVARENAIRQILINNHPDKPLNSLEMEALRQIVQKKMTDPNGVIEEGYADQVINNLKKTAQDNPDSFLNDSFRQAPGQSKQIMDTGSYYKYQNERIQTEYEKAEEEYQHQSWAGWSVDQAKVFVPFYWELKMRHQVGDTPFLDGLLGTNLAEQRRDMYRLDREKFDSSIDTINKSFVSNPTAKLAFWSAMSGQSKNEQLLNNALGAIGLVGDASAVGLTKLLRTGVSKAILKNDLPASKAMVNEVTGNIKEAGIQQATSEISGKGNPAVDELKGMPSVFDTGIKDLDRGSRPLSQELNNRIKTAYVAFKDRFTQAVNNMVNVERLPAVFAVEKNVRALEAHVAAQFPGIENTVNDVRFSMDALGNRYVNTVFLKNGTQLWGAESSAQKFIRDNKLPSATTKVDQEGGGWFVTNVNPFNARDPFVQSLLLTTEETQTPRTWINTMYNGLIGKWRTPDDTMAPANIANRKVAVVGPNNFFELIKEDSKEINQLPRWSDILLGKNGRWNQWKRVMSAAEQTRHPVTGEFDGFHTPSDLVNLYQSVLHRAPDEQEIAAAFSMKRKWELVDILNKAQELKRQFYQGAEQHTFQIPVGLTTGGNITLKDIKAYGIKLNELPKSQASMLIVRQNPKDNIIVDASKYRSKAAERLTEEVSTGKKVAYRITNPEEYPFKDLSIKNAKESKVEFIVMDNTYNVKSQPVQWGDIKVGKVSRTDYAHYVAQPMIKQDPVTGIYHYLGDRTIMGHSIGTIARDYATKLDKIRELIAVGKDAEAKAFHASSGLQQEHSMINMWFKQEPSTADWLSGQFDNILSPLLNTKENIRVVPNGKRTIDIDNTLKEKYPNLKDSQVIDRGNPDPYDLFSVANTGTKDNPLYNIAPTKYIDPMININRTLVRAVNGLWMNDYKTMSVEHWIQEAASHLKGDPEDIIKNPYYYFYKSANDPGMWRGVNNQAETALKLSNLNVQQFLGVTDNVTKSIHYMSQVLADAMYNAGPVKKTMLYPLQALQYVRDPFTWMRSFAFNSVMGLFNPAQLWVQASTFANTFLISPRFAVSALKATTFHIYAEVAERVGVDAERFAQFLDGRASLKLIPGMPDFKPGEFMEARNLVKSLGWDKVGREHIYQDSVAYTNLVGSGTSKFLNAGQAPFRWGETFNRLSAWYTAYKEFRDIHPTGAISQKDIRDILTRADLLSTNMTRASASQLQKGVLSIPSTFQSYTLRLAEQMYGKRLTPLEKARMIGGYSLLYGMGGAWGLSGLPIGDYVNKWAIENGYIRQNSDYVTNMLSEGLPALALQLISGEWYNVQQKIANPSGISSVGDMLKGDSSWWKIILGAPGNIVGNTIKNMNGFYRMAIDATFGDGEFKPKIEDFLDPFNSIKSISLGRRLWFTLNTINEVTGKGKVPDSQESYIGDASTGNAIFQFLSGLSPQEQVSKYYRQWSANDEKDSQSQALKDAVKEMHRAFRDYDNNDRSNAEDHVRRSMAILKGNGYPVERYHEFWALSAQDYMPTTETEAYRFYTKNVNEFKREIYDAAYRKLIESK